MGDLSGQAGPHAQPRIWITSNVGMNDLQGNVVTLQKIVHCLVDLSHVSLCDKTDNQDIGRNKKKITRASFGNPLQAVSPAHQGMATNDINDACGAGLPLLAVAVTLAYFVGAFVFLLLLKKWIESQDKVAMS
jgi:hypothetical protein